jgi:hypothetical protein
MPIDPWAALGMEVISKPKRKNKEDDIGLSPL